ncbi:MAG: DNA methyltransferase [Polyangiaceae bacterium]
MSTQRKLKSGLHAGDCLDILPTLIGQAEVDLVYWDPPFAAGGTRGARAEKGERLRGEAAYHDAWGGIDAWLEMMRPRAERVGQILSPQGSIWLHLDHRAVHEAKWLFDELFGRKAFKGEIIWVPGNGARNTKGPSVTHQTILVYAPRGKMIWNVDHPALREPFAETSQRMHFRQVDADGRRYRERVIGGKAYRYYADVGRRLGSVWTDCPAMNANTPLTQETTGYPTQKPESLLERIIHAASLPDSWVLDPMSGSGTTLAVARRLERRWLGVDRSPVALRIASQRLGVELAKPARRSRG